MSATTVYTALNSFIPSSSGPNTIDLWLAANDSTDLAGMLPILALYGINSSYIVSSVVLTLSPSETGVSLTGTGTFSNPNATTPGTTYNVTIGLYYTQDTNTFSLLMNVVGTWSFINFFGELPDTLMSDPSGGVGITWYPSILANFTVNGAVFSGRTGAEKLTLTGSLLEPTEAYIVEKIPMISPWPLSLSGTIELATVERTYPLVELNARGNNTVITGQPESGVQGPAVINLEDPGITLIIAKLVPPQPDKIAFSTIELFGDFAIGEIKGRISTLIYSTGSLWNFTVVFSENATLVQGLAELMAIFGVELPVPMNFPVLKDFYVAQLDIDLQNTAANGSMPSFTLQNFGMTIRSNKEWNPPIPFVTLSNVGTRWVWGWTMVNDVENGGMKKTYTLNGSVFGTLNIGGSSASQMVLPLNPITPIQPVSLGKKIIEDSEPVRINVNMSLPNFIINGYLAKDSYIPIGDALNFYFGNDGPSTGIQTMNIIGLNFSADPIGQNYYADASILFGEDLKNPDAQQGWEINLGILTIILNQLEFYIRVNNGNVSGGINGTFYLVQGDPSNYELPRIMLSAEYPPQDPTTPEGWTLSGYLYPGTSISLTTLVYQFIYGEKGTVPDWVPDLAVDRLEARLTTGSGSTNPSYTFGGTISVRWTPTIFGTPLKINAAASMDMEKLSTAENATGSLSGLFSVNKISLTASLTFGVPEPTYLFKVQFDQLWLQATTAWRGESDNRHQVISLQLGGVTLGDILEYLVNLAAPTLGFKLDSPWDVLKQVDLSQFVLTIDPQENIVEFVFNTNVNLVIAELTSIGVRYTKKSGEGKVDLILTGSFLGQTYNSNDPLAWDVINDPPPSVPGDGISLIDLRYLGIGQHVTFKGEVPNTVKESIDKLRKNMQPTDPDGNPMPATMQYSKDSEWLIGLDITIMEAIDFAFIFNDPVLYGLSLGLRGEKVGGLAGLRFEILYKKITDDIGMFRVEFQVPDMFRTIQLGVASITLGIIVVEIYTNGNFKVDLGFPYNRNFDRAFSLQAYIFIGRGGFYLGVLNGDTSTQVPKISNGNFSPVIELGVGIAAGVGREIRKGILSGGAYVQLEVLFEGVLAWFNPTNNGSSTATYFKCTGVAAVHGKVYGSVDFKVIKVSVTLEAYAQVTLIYESYQPLLIDFTVDVSAKASVKILFVRIHFSFNVNLNLSFTVGSASPTPWILDNSGGSSGGSSQFAVNSKQKTTTSRPRSKNSYYLRANKHRRQQALKNAHMVMYKNMIKAGKFKRTAFEEIAISDEYLLNFQPSDTVFPDAPRKAHMTLLPVFTIGNVPINWNTTIPVNNEPDYRTSFVLFADSGIAPEAKTAADCKNRSASLSAMTNSAEDTSTLAADILVQGLSKYTINALPRSSSQGNDITAGQLELLIEQLDLPETLTTGFSITSLATFFNTNINLWISGDPGSNPNEKGAMVIPMPPFLNWTSSQGGNVNFNTKNEIGTLYEWGITQFLNSYFSMGIEGNTEAPTDDDPTQYESFTSFMFRDFCLMMVQNALLEMQKHLNNTTVTVTEVAGAAQTLAQIANGLPQTDVGYIINTNDTVESVAENLGATVEEIEFLNPNLAAQLATEPVGKELSITLGIAPEVLAIDNPDEAFAINQCMLGTLVHQANQDETLGDIASLFQIANVSTLLSYSDPILSNLTTSSQILNQGKTFSIATQTFTYIADNTLRVAGIFFTRYFPFTIFNQSLVPEIGNWYAQAISELNDLANLYPNQKIVTDLELPPGQTITVPNLYNDKTQTNSYVTVNGDTLTRIGIALALAQDYGTTSVPLGVPEWATFRDGVVATGTTSYTIPAKDDVAIGYGESIEALVRRLIVSATWSQTQTNPVSGIWTYDWTAVSIWLGPAKVLIPLASITVPNAKTGEHTPLNFAVIAKTYGVPIVDAAGILKDEILFAVDTVLKVTLLPAQDIDVLISSVLEGDSFASVVNQSSRMLMSGLQLPDLKEENGHTVPDTENLLPLYDLTGQQFDLTVDTTEPTETALTLDLASQETWIVLMNSITVTSTDTLAALETEYPDLLTYNPGLSETTFTVGMVLLTGPVESTLNYSYTNQEILDNSPATGLSIVPISSETPTPTSPSVLPLSASVIKTYGLDKSIELQTPISLPIPQLAGQENVTGNPTLWPFSGDILQKAKDGVTTPYEILYSKTDGQAGSESIMIQDATYGMLLPFKIKRLEDNSTNQFELIGVDTDHRNTLISLINWLDTQPLDDETKAYTLLSPAPNSTNTSGLTVLTTTPTDIYLIKSNLSTESAPPPTAARATFTVEDDTANYFANMSSLADFVTLLWEGSVVGGIGYFFGTTDNLPSSAFDDQGNITLQLLVIAGIQQDVAPEGRSLLPFNNCALVSPGVDNSLQTLYMESADSTLASETTVQAIVPPGNVGFELLLDNPDVENVSVSDQENQLKNLYSLLSFGVEEVTGSPFYAKASGMPVLSSPSDGTTTSNAEKARNSRKEKQYGITSKIAEETPEIYSKYQQLLPVNNFVLDTIIDAAPAVSGLPEPTNDPYHGFGTEASLPTAKFVFSFGDILGNRTGTTGTDQGVTDISVGYTDDLIGISEWPSMASYFEVEAAANNEANVTIVISTRPSELLPTPSQRGDINAANITQQTQKYRDIYYQLVQPNIKAWLVTSLKVVADDHFDNKGIQINDISPLYRFAAGAYANFNSIASMTPTKPVGTTTIGDIISVYGVRHTELAQANATSQVIELFGSNIPVVPAYYPFVEYQSMAAVYNMPPNGWPKQATPAAVLEDPENTTLPLRVNTIINIPSVSITTTDTKSLKALGNQYHTDPVLLAIKNQDKTVLQNGFEFELEVSDEMLIVVTVDETTNSFSLVRDKFIAEGVNTSVDELAQTNIDAPGIFALSQELEYTNYVTKESDTLETNSSGASVNDLASLNAKTKNLFDPGALIYFGVFNISADDATPTLQEFGDRYACPLELLLKANDSFILPASSTFVVPGTLSWPTITNTLRTPYTISATDTLNIITAKFSKADGTGDANQLLAKLNENMPNTLISNLDLMIDVGGTNYTVNTGENPSFASVLTSLQTQIATATLEDIVNSIGDETNVLYPGGLLSCPPAKIATTTKPNEIEDLYGISAATFGLGNAAMQNLIVAGITLACFTELVTITTQANDTFNSLMTRFADAGVSVNIPEIMSVNNDIAFIKSDGLALLPSSEIRLTANIGTGGPYLAPISPLTTSLRIIRPEALIYPSFENTTAEVIESLVPAPTGNENTENGGLNYNDFVEALEAALPNIRLATGQVDGIAQDLWTVNFDANGIDSVALVGETIVLGENQPRFFALAPLYKHLVTRPEVLISPLLDDGQLGTPEKVAFQSIDTEVWARKFVEDFDRFVAGTSVIKLYDNENLRPYLEEILGVKQQLIPSIAKDLTNVLNVEDTGSNPALALATAQKSLEQQLGVSLARTYEATVMVQYTSTVNSAWQTNPALLPASLYGDGSIVGYDKGITIVSAKTKLNESDFYVDFLLTLDNPALHRNITGAFEYGISHVEFNIKEQTSISGEYKSSDWLTFVPLLRKDGAKTTKPTALVGTDPGSVDVPIPLKLFPGSPIIMGQSANQQIENDTKEVSQLSLWKYNYNYSHEHAEQDYVIIIAEFNLTTPQLKSRLLLEDKDLFTELAQYNSIATKLWEYLSALTDAKVQVTSETLKNAVATFTSISQSIADCWETRFSETQSNTNDQDNLVAALSYSFEARVDYDLNTYTLKSSQTPVGPNDTWPTVYLQQTDGKFVALVPGTPEGTSLTYTTPEGTSIPSTNWPVFKLVWEMLNIAEIQNARGKMWVERNQNLIDNVETNNDFIFATNLIVAPSVVTPLNSFGNRININNLGDNLTDALNAVFTNLFGANANGQIITMELSYGFELVAPQSQSSQGLVTYLPIGLYPNQTISDTTASNLNAAIEAWKVANQPSEQGGEWVFSLKMYSQLTDNTYTLLAIDHLVYSIIV